MVEQSDQTADRPERERAISERAYAFWLEEGRPEGKELEHWLQAEQEHDDPKPAASRGARGCAGSGRP
ncbi:MAG: DUF2934 domain-containing protein [Acetobacteraceae bacterium]|nr:DUF2934 domain-containing protein [Acetobacteraceae bacterium]